jgi:hypothetical protein
MAVRDRFDVVEPRFSTWRAVPVPELAGLTVEWAEPSDYILSRREILFHAPSLETPLEAPLVELGRVPLTSHLRLGSRLEPVRRALRLDYYNVVRTGGERLFVTFNRSVALITPEGTRSITGLERPFRVLRGGCAVAPDGSVFFGEYVTANEFTPLRIYRLEPGSERAEIVHCFPRRFAWHIHGIHLDPFDQSIWCLTGDHGEHAKILRSPDGLPPFTAIGTGDETWRVVSVQFREDAVYYASDAQHRQNWIYRIDRATGERTEVAPLDGPVYYSHRVGDDLFFAVTAEARSNGHRQRATLWHLDPDDNCTEVISFPKDRWPTHQFLPGTLSFPGGSGDGTGFYFSGVALSQVHRATFHCSPAGSEPL